MKNAIKKLLALLETGTDVEKVLADNMLCMMKHVAENDFSLRIELDKAIEEHCKEEFIEKYGEEEVKSWKFLAYQMGSRSSDATRAKFRN